jgi:2-polyprenyl-6-hydroxyphenyl methylase/3-demethylubiquinone-9 3-methyltransferase
MSEPASATTTQDLAGQGYWETVWNAKDAAGWASLGWIRARYSWVVLDAMLRRRLRDRPRRHLLEVGCATGRWLIYFHRTFGYAVTGCDYSETGCASARASLAAAGIAGEVIQDDLFNLQGRYDAIFSGGLIEHFDDPRRVLQKFHGMLEPGGTLITIVPNLRGLSGLYHRLLKPETFSTHRPVTVAELRRWYRELGLADTAAGALGSFVPSRFPRDKVRRTHPRLYRILWPLLIRPLTQGSNALCTLLFRRLGVRIESPLFSPYLYAIGERR